MKRAGRLPRKIYNKIIPRIRPTRASMLAHNIHRSRGTRIHMEPLHRLREEITVLSSPTSQHTESSLRATRR